MAMRALYFALVGILCLASFGCQDVARQEALEHGRQALESSRSALSIAFGSLLQETQDLTQHSSRESLEEARKRLVDLQTKLANLDAPSQLDRLRMEVLQNQIDRLDTALAVRTARKEVELLVIRAEEQAALAGQTLAEKRKELRERDEAFRSIDDRLIAAERAYSEAGNRLTESVALHQALEGTRN
jgi:hypothetical protein